MPRVFRAQSILAAVLMGIALLAMPRMTLGQSTAPQYQTGAFRQPDGIAPASYADDIATDSQVPAPPPAVPVSPNTVAQIDTRAAAAAPTGAAASSAAVFSLSMVPNMIGDTSGVGCGALTINGAVVASIMHPTFSCSRLNIAEDNSPVVQDRFYVDFRDFQGASGVNIFGDTPHGGTSTLNLDRLVLGWERTIGEANSIEFRVPVNRELNSDLNFTQMTGAGGMPPPITNTAEELHNTDTEIGNIDVVFKHRLVDTEDVYLSTGVGVNLPTAPGVEINAQINDAAFQFFPPGGGGPLPMTHNVQLLLASTVLNQTVNLSPFLGGIYHPSADWFVQGFLQVDIPLNRSGANLTEALTIDGFSEPDETHAVSGKLEEQVLGRVNLGIGHWLWYGDNSRSVNSLGLVFEAHYSTTLNNAALLGPFTVAPAFNPPAPPPPNPNFIPATQLTVGNLNNHLDGLDFVLAVPAVFGRTTITNAFCLPALPAPDRGFTFEYILAVDRMF